MFVLATGMVIAVIAAAVLTVAQVNGRVVSQANDSAEAEVLAENAVEYALNVIANDSNWRTDYPALMAVGPVPMGRGTISFTLADDMGGTLATSTTDSIRIYGTGKVRNATKVYSLKAAPVSPLNCLQTVMDVSGAATFGSTMTISGSGLIASNVSVTGNSNNFNALNVEAVTTVLLCSGTGTHTGLAAARSLPDSTHVFDFYKTNGTSISIGSLPKVGVNYQCFYRVLSPSVNTLGGGTNASGIYVIDCQNNNIQVAFCRVVGTLVLLNVGSASTVQSSNYFQTGTNGYPVLMVQGAITIKTASANLVDNSATGNATVASINYNQTGAPYQGVADTTFTTAYPSRFDGLVYVSGALTTSTVVNINGVLIVGGAYTGTTLSTLTLNYDSSSYKNPPPGFTGGSLAPVSGSWRWEPGP
ncbi:MAG: hypothetical protein JWN51_1118 [Phycisphaerales bacterium]|nr:hypothetical protein [Phycisphaerales bacterium]